jgi:hypothetical protein
VLVVQQRFQIVENTLPLIVMRMPAIVDAEAIQAMMDGFDRAHRRGERFAAVLDATDVKRLPDSGTRRRLVEWMLDDEHVRCERALTVAVATVVPSSLVRAFVAAVYFVHPPCAPQQWSPSYAEGIEWTCARLVEAGIPLTPEIERMREEGVAPSSGRLRGGDARSTGTGR